MIPLQHTRPTLTTYGRTDASSRNWPVFHQPVRHHLELIRIARRLCLALALMTAPTMFIGCTTSNDANYKSQSETQRNPLEAQRLTQQAAAIIDSDQEEAEKLLRKALIADLYHGPAHNNLGIIHLERGDLYEAANEFEWARKLMPGHPDPRLNLAITLEKAGQSDEALATYHTTLEVYPNYIPAIEAITRLMIRQGESLNNTSSPNDSNNQLNENLKQIALRGSSEQWRQWAAEQRAKSHH